MYPVVSLRVSSRTKPSHPQEAAPSFTHYWLFSLRYLPSLLFSQITFQSNYLHSEPCPNIGFGGTQAKRVPLEQGFPCRTRSEPHSAGGRGRSHLGLNGQSEDRGAKCMRGTCMGKHCISFPSRTTESVPRPVLLHV